MTKAEEAEFAERWLRITTAIKNAVEKRKATGGGEDAVSGTDCAG
jgi:hypothetical protein